MASSAAAAPSTACCCRQAVLLNLKFNEVVASFANAAGVGSGDQLRASATKPKPGGAACTCIAFRTGSGVPLMAAGGGAGVITVWNLDERRLHTIVKVHFTAFACSPALCDHAQPLVWAGSLLYECRAALTICTGHKLQTAHTSVSACTASLAAIVCCLEFPFALHIYVHPDAIEGLLRQLLCEHMLMRTCLHRSTLAAGFRMHMMAR